MTLYLVTGGAGFIGSHIVETLIARGDQVRVLDNFATGKRANLAHLAGVEVKEGDIREVNLVQQVMRDVDYVIHQAAQISVTQSMMDPVTTHDVNVTGTLNLLKAAQEQGVKRFVLASSCAVYGNNADLPIKESALPQPLSPYAASKLIGEIYSQMYYSAYGLPTVCLRYFNVYGPRQDPNGEYAAVIPKFVQRIKQARAPIIYGDGLQTRDFVYVDDVVRANLLACDQPGAIGQVFNVASGRGVSLLDLIAELNGICHSRLQPQFEPARNGDIRHSRGDGTKLAMVLNGKPLTSLTAGLQQLVEES